MFSTEVKFITSDESINIKNGDFKSYKYETKKRADESVYDAGKRSYCERRGGLWRAHRPRQIRQLESKLRDRSVVYCEFSSDSLITIVFSSGAIAYLTIRPETLDVTKVLFDRYCVGRLTSSTVTGVVFCKSHLLLTHADRNATLVSFGKNATTQPCRISDRDPHLQNIELGGSARKAERKVSFIESTNSQGVRVLIWSASAAEPALWSPALEPRANLHLYQLTGQQVTLIAYHQLENDTLSAELAHKSDSVIHIVEQIPSHKTGVSLDWIRYEVPVTEDVPIKLSSLRGCMSRVLLPAPARAVVRSPCDTRLLAACIDGSLHVALAHATEAGAIHCTRAGFIPREVSWAGGVVVAVEEGRRVHCFDTALAPLSHHNHCLHFAHYNKEVSAVRVLANRAGGGVGGGGGGPLLVVACSGGPPTLALLRISHPKLLTAWIRLGKTANAVSLLRSLDWDTEGTDGLWAINHIVCASLRRGLDTSSESLAQSALGAYLAPPAPHGAPAERLAPAVHDLARKFFHHLLRGGRIEKALSLAVDLADWDLFCDARHAAARRGLAQLADEAASLALHYAAQQESDSESCSQCSSHSYTDSDGDSSASSDVQRTKPPPLPRVTQHTSATIIPISHEELISTNCIRPKHQYLDTPLPRINHTSATIVHVPISHAEPISTNSIRPNLHQYLDRDNTIWNTAIRDDSHITIKPILNTQLKWHSMENFLNYKPTTKHNTENSVNYTNNPYTKHSLVTINEGSSKTLLNQDERLTPAHFRHILQTELIEEVPNTLYRYQSGTNNYLPGPSRYRDEMLERSRSGERNKVKFSDKVTINVVPESASNGPSIPVPARELADSLPLSPPHAYLSAFAPATTVPPPPPPPGAQTPGTAPRDYVEV